MLRQDDFVMASKGEEIGGTFKCQNVWKDAFDGFAHSVQYVHRNREGVRDDLWSRLLQMYSGDV